MKRKFIGVSLVLVMGITGVVLKDSQVIADNKVAEVSVNETELTAKTAISSITRDKATSNEEKDKKSEAKKSKVEETKNDTGVKGAKNTQKVKKENDKSTESTKEKSTKEIKKETSVESKPTQKTEAQSKPQSKPEVKPQPKPQPKPEPKPQPKPQPSPAELKQREIDGWVNGLPGALSKHYNGMVQTDRVIAVSPNSNAWIESGVFYYRDIHEVTQKTIYHEVGHLWDQFTELSMTPEFYAIYLDEWADSGYYGGTNAQEAVAETIAHIYLGTDAPHIPRSIEMTKQFLGLTPLSAENQKYAAMIRGEMRQWEVNASPTYNKVFENRVEAFSDYGFTPTKGGTPGMRYREVAMRRYGGVEWVVVQLSNHRTVIVRKADL